MKSKRKAQIIHASARAVERVGIILSERKNAEVVKMIQNKQAVFVRRQSKRVSIWDVCFEETEMRVAYDKDRKVIVTVMTKDMQ